MTEVSFNNTINVTYVYPLLPRIPLFLSTSLLTYVSRKPFALSPRSTRSHRRSYYLWITRSDKIWLCLPHASFLFVICDWTLYQWLYRYNCFCHFETWHGVMWLDIPTPIISTNRLIPWNNAYAHIIFIYIYIYIYIVPLHEYRYARIETLPNNSAPI